nr:hypothetical protein GCM10020093_084540 [Planobispora longispora]
MDDAPDDERGIPAGQIVLGAISAVVLGLWGLWQWVGPWAWPSAPAPWRPAEPDTATGAGAGPTRGADGRAPAPTVAAAAGRAAPGAS